MPAERADPSPGIPWHIIQKISAMPLCRMMGRFAPHTAEWPEATLGANAFLPYRAIRD